MHGAIQRVVARRDEGAQFGYIGLGQRVTGGHVLGKLPVDVVRRVPGRGFLRWPVLRIEVQGDGLA